ncbi:MAG: sodium/proline symporter PutP [Alphaproteobacteria bacterium]|nr:sodium/proline symporter PutP [Alphaproteobacteria bacterium]
MKIIVLLFYIFGIYLIGAIASKRTKTTSDYLLGNRSLDTYTTAFGVGASDMSGWLMMALPGAILISGASTLWMIIGLIGGAYLNWRLVGNRLRNYTEKYGNALTIPCYLSNRFKDDTNSIRVATGIILLIFFTVYTSSGLIACSIIVQNEFNIDYHYSLLISAIIIVIYTSIGGFIAISWIDVFQGILMLIAIIAVPVVAIHHFGGIEETFDTLALNNINFSNPFKGNDAISITSMVGWGLGYFGQIHILLRFMSAKSSKVIDNSRKICMTWMILALAGAAFVGLFGTALFAQNPLENPETVFFKSADLLFPTWASGILLAAVFSAIMSTVSAQLLASSSAIVEDISLQFSKKDFTDKTRLVLNRTAVLFIMIAATTIAYNPKSNILSIVAYAWAGLGASFGPVIIMSLYWKNMTKLGAVFGIITGGLVVILWKNLAGYHELFSIYEIIPAFICSCIAVLIGSKLETSGYLLSINK